MPLFAIAFWEYHLFMVGTVLGAIVGWVYLSSSWQPLSQDEGVFSGFGQAIVILLVCLVAGILVFPRTVGIMFTPTIFIAPIAFIIGWIKNGFLFGVSQLLFGVIAWGITQIIAKFRPSAV